VTFVLSSVVGAITGARISEWVEHEHGHEVAVLLSFVCLGVACIFWARSKV
jgi:hypothetical protein